MQRRLDALPRDILQQFSIEAVVLCLLGGAIGIGLGRASVELVRLLLHWPTPVSIAAVIATATPLIA